MPDYRLERANRFDLLGFLLFAAASALLLTASELAGAHPVPWARIGLCGARGPRETAHSECSTSVRAVTRACNLGPRTSSSGREN